MRDLNVRNVNVGNLKAQVFEGLFKVTIVRTQKSIGEVDALFFSYNISPSVCYLKPVQKFPDYSKSEMIKRSKNCSTNRSTILCSNHYHRIQTLKSRWLPIRLSAEYTLYGWKRCKYSVEWLSALKLARTPP